MEKRKIKLYGWISKPVALKNNFAKLKITPGNKPGTLIYESQGVAVAFNGGGDVTPAQATYREAAELAKTIVDRGGLILNGGRNTGVMEASLKAAGNYGLGILFPGQVVKGVSSKSGRTVTVDSPATRLNLLTTCPLIVVIFGGGLGTLHELINVMVTVKNQSYGLPAPTILAYKSWKKTLNFLREQNAISQKYFNAVIFFSSAEEAEKIIFAN